VVPLGFLAIVFELARSQTKVETVVNRIRASGDLRRAVHGYVSRSETVRGAGGARPSPAPSKLAPLRAGPFLLTAKELRTATHELHLNNRRPQQVGRLRTLPFPNRGALD
jgi:hypothetical protein